VQIDPALVIAKDATTKLVLDFDLTRSFNVTGQGGEPTCDDLKASNKVLFHPVIRAINLSNAGLLRGVVEDSGGTGAQGVEVTAVAANGDPSDPAAIVGTTLSADGSDPDAPLGSYALILGGGHVRHLRARARRERAEPRGNRRGGRIRQGGH